MSQHRRRAALAGATTVAVSLTLAAPAALAAQDGATVPPPASQASTRGLLDGLLGSVPVVGGIVSGLPIVGGGTSGVGGLPTLPVVGDLLAGLPPLPIVGDILGGATSGSDPLSALLPALAGLSAGLPTDGLPAGTVPTGAALKPATDLLRQIAAVTADTPLGAVLTSLADQIDGVGDAGVSPDVLSVLALTLGSVANTPGVPDPVKQQAAMLASQVAPKAPTTTPTTTTTPTKPVATAPAPTSKPVVPAPKPVATAAAPKAKPVGKARITGVRVKRGSSKIRVAMKCPANGPTCKSIVAGGRGSHGRVLATSTIMMTVGAGHTSARNLKLNSASHRAIKKRTTKFRVSAIRPGGSLSQRSTTTRVPKKHKSHKSHN